MRIDYYGTPTPLNQVASLSVHDATLLVIQPWDPSVIATIEHAILKANIGLNPMNDGKVIKLPVPPPTEERRKEIVKIAHEYAERTRTAVRNVRREGNDELRELEKEGLISEDDLHRGLEEVQKLTDEHIENIHKVAHRQGEGNPRGVIARSARNPSERRGSRSPQGGAH